MRLCFVDCKGLCAPAQAAAPAGGPIAVAEAMGLWHIGEKGRCLGVRLCSVDCKRLSAPCWWSNRCGWGCWITAHLGGKQKFWHASVLLILWVARRLKKSVFKIFSFMIFLCFFYDLDLWIGKVFFPFIILLWLFYVIFLMAHFTLFFNDLFYDFCSAHAAVIKSLKIIIHKTIKQIIKIINHKIIKQIIKIIKIIKQIIRKS